MGHVPELVTCGAVGALHDLELGGGVAYSGGRYFAGDVTLVVNSQAPQSHPGVDHYHIAHLEVALHGDSGQEKNLLSLLFLFSLPPPPIPQVNNW